MQLSGCVAKVLVSISEASVQPVLEEEGLPTQPQANGLSLVWMHEIL